jgi:hypothetical protein
MKNSKLWLENKNFIFIITEKEREREKNIKF